MIEEWKEYVTYNHSVIVTKIRVSNFGNIEGEIYNNKPLNIYIRNGRKFLNGIPIFKLVDLVFNGYLPKGYVVHHVDRNKLNDRLDNLQRMTKSEHVSLHMKGNKYTEGFQYSEETRKIWSEQRKGNTNVRNRIWITKEGKSKLVYPNEIDKYLKEGYEVGRNTKGRIPWNKKQN